jgi:hypothetical protein
MGREEMSCPHCGHDWDRHGKQCADCGCLWPDPRIPEPPAPRGQPYYPGYPYEGVIDAEALYDAFWTAAKTLTDDDSVHDMDKPYLDQEMDMIDCTGSGMPYAFWDHMARALAGPSA